MTELFEKAVATMRELPAETQDSLARIILSLTDDDLPPLQLSDAEAESLELSRQEAARREFASDEQVAAVWAKHRL